MTDADRVRQAVEDWYSANYPAGVRLHYRLRHNLAEHIIRRLSLVETPKAPITEDGPAWRVNR